MNILVRKMSKLGLLKLELILGTSVMAVAMLFLPISILSVDITLMANPYVFSVVLIGMLLFGVAGFFCFIRPYLLFRKFPKVQAEADDEFLYIYANKTVKIPLKELSDVVVRVELPYLLQKEFLREFIIHIFSEEYGDIVLEIPEYGTYRMRFVAHVKTTANGLIHFLNNL